jgi:type 1 glutamine amidotransferase
MNGLLVSALTFVAADANKDGVVTREEWTATGRELFGAADAPGAGSITRGQLQPVLNEAMPLTGLAAVFNMGGGPQPTTPQAASVDRMMAALPARAPASPSRPRRVLVFARAAGFVHSSIPLAAKTVEALGAKTGAWTTTISYDAADITAENLKEYDALFLASTTGAFLDEPGNDTVTAARRQALLDFVRGGKGLAGIHAASDSYHMDKTPAAGGVDMAALLAGFSPGATLAPAMVAHGDSNGDDRLDRAEMDALLDGWFRMMDTTGSGQLLQSDVALLALLIPHPPADAAAPVPQGRDPQVGTWPDFNRMIGGFFKYHWLDPQKITVKIDDATSPLTAMFNGQSFDVHDEIYTMSADSWSRRNVRVLTSIDYEKMSPADRALEEYPRADHDHGISWIRREGDGRVFYLSLGHSERIYADRRILEHLLAGMQYVLGDLAADDAPSVR